jgi:hypothetical protein
MTSIAPVVTLSPRDYDAVLFDLDGVLTKTASVHAAAWKRLFDGFLEQRAANTGETFVAFDIDADYRRYVDGKPRYDGVAAFLESRGIALPFGAPEDDPGARGNPRNPVRPGEWLFRDSRLNAFFGSERKAPPSVRSAVPVSSSLVCKISARRSAVSGLISSPTSSWVVLSK